MAIYTNTFEGGSDGVSITTGNSGGISGRAFDAVSGSATYTADSCHGSLAVTANASAVVRWNTTDTVILARTYYKMATFDGQVALRLVLSTASVQVMTLTGGNAGRIQLYHGSSGGVSPGPISLNTWYRFELYVKEGNGDGVIRLAVYEGDSLTAWWDSGDVTGRTIPTFQYVYYGQPNASATEATWDSIGLKTNADATWGAWPHTSTSGPTIVIARPADNLVDLRSSTSGDASSLTYPTPVHVSGATLTTTSLTSGLWLFSQDSASSAVYTVRVTQGDSQTASQDVTIPALSPPPTQTIPTPLRLLSAPPSSNWG